MKIDEILELWEQDSIIDKTNISQESLNIPKLHSKYYNIFIREKILLDKLNLQLKEIELERWNFYNGSAPTEQYESYEGNFFDLKLLKQDKERFFESDKEIMEHKNKIMLQKAKTECLFDIIKMISNRSFQIKNFIEYEKFKAAEF